MEPLPSWLSFLSPFTAGLLLATGVGLIVGLEREFSTKGERGHLAGLRTFPLLAILGFLASWLSQKQAPWLLPVAAAGLFLLVTTAYFAQTREQRYGLTTEVSLLITFVLGAMAAYNYYMEALMIAVVVTALLSLKEEFHWLMEQITQTEMFAFIKFAVLAILLLPVLPDQTFGPENILNYRDLGWIILLVSSISFAGYLLLKFAGARKGILLTALVGGLVSSTMITWVFAARSRETPAFARTLGAGIVLSSTVMFGRVFLLAWLFNQGLAWRMALPCFVLLCACLFMVWWIERKAQKEDHVAVQLPLGNPLDIRNALFFAILYVGVALAMYYSKLWFGQTGAYATAALSGVADMDAISINTAKWAAADQYTLAARVLLVAMLSNTTFKMSVGLLRAHADLRPFLRIGFGVMLLIGVLSLLLV